MENNAPFYVGQKVVRLVDCSTMKKGEVGTVKTVRLCGYKKWRLSLEEKVDYCDDIYQCQFCLKEAGDVPFEAKNFAPINPYSNSVSKELANEAIKENIEVDVPVKKEVVNN